MLCKTSLSSMVGKHLCRAVRREGGQHAAERCLRLTPLSTRARSHGLIVELNLKHLGLKGLPLRRLPSLAPLLARALRHVLAFKECRHR